ncbi:MAG: dipeptidyl carboxypeptidase II, partial [Proteobacteria bacterium]|nr:dipeptidyl carboxypeptidase II [Pseudomonadota bacterium]
MFRIRLLPLAMTTVLAACAPAPHKSEPAKAAAAPAPAHVNPFMSASTLPFLAPPFDKITDADYQPAIEEGIRQQLAEAEGIANNPAPPTFENTYVALEKSGELLTRVMPAFNGVAGANTDDTLQKVQEDVAPKLSELADAIHLNDKLFARVDAVYNERAKLKLDPEALRLVDVVHAQFVHAGAKLSAEDKAKLKTLNTEEASLEAAFNNKLLAAAKAGALVVDDKARLAGLSDADIAAAAQSAKDRGLAGKWVIPLQNTTQQPDLQDMTDRA